MELVWCTKKWSIEYWITSLMKFAPWSITIVGQIG